MRKKKRNIDLVCEAKIIEENRGEIYYMESNQQQFIEYVKGFAKENKSHIWLSGSFLNGTATIFSDVDISVFCNIENLNKLIYGYGNPVYISFTHKPLGILIVIYENGVAVDLEIVEKVDVTAGDFFHCDDIKLYDYTRNENICKQISLRDDMHYQISRLLHRSLIKFLSGKHDIGVSIANEVSELIKSNLVIDKTSYKKGINELVKVFNEQYQLPLEYFEILCELIDKLDS
ncbi:MAG: nucleotidyltransferase domain-containing protein [Lachnospiraceae bacterium]|nr:nucleotidyltransferase domain-containing protein [Lachnospiraceae bacterium]